MTTPATPDGTCGNCHTPPNECGIGKVSRDAGKDVPAWCHNWTPRPKSQLLGMPYRGERDKPQPQVSPIPAPVAGGQSNCTCGNCGMPLHDCGVEWLAREVGMAVPIWCKNWKPIPYAPTVADIMAALEDDGLKESVAMKCGYDYITVEICREAIYNFGAALLERIRNKEGMRI